MREFLLADRYARALRASIPQEGDLEIALTALQGFTVLFEEQHDLHSALSNPVIDIDARIKVLDETLALHPPPATVARRAFASPPRACGK